MALHKGPNLHHIWWWEQWKSNCSADDLTCNPCLEAFHLVKPTNPAVTISVYSRHIWKTPTCVMALHKGPNLLHKWWWGQWKTNCSAEWSKLQPMFASLPASQTNKSCCHYFRILKALMEKNDPCNGIPYGSQLTPYLVMGAVKTKLFCRMV